MTSCAASPYVNSAIRERDPSIQKPAHRFRIDHVFLLEHPCGKRNGIVVRAHGHRRLDDDRTVVEFAVTKCTVQPCTLTPAASARSCVCSPGTPAEGTDGY